MKTKEIFKAIETTEFLTDEQLNSLELGRETCKSCTSSKKNDIDVDVDLEIEN